MEQIIFTPSALESLLRSIDELAEYDISVDDTDNDSILLRIGDSDYYIETEEAEDVEVDEDVLDDIEEINDITFADNEDIASEYDSGLEDIESGLLSQVVKTLLVGGMVRLTNKVLGDDRK